MHEMISGVIDGCQRALSAWRRARRAASSRRGHGEGSDQDECRGTDGAGGFVPHPRARDAPGQARYAASSGRALSARGSAVGLQRHGEFLGGQSGDRESMDRPVHQVTNRAENELLASQPTQTDKCRSGDQHAEVRFPARSRAGMAGMHGGLVVDLEMARSELLAQARLEQFCCSHQSTALHPS